MHHLIVKVPDVFFQAQGIIYHAPLNLSTTFLQFLTFIFRDIEIARIHDEINLLPEAHLPLPKALVPPYP